MEMKDRLERESPPASRWMSRDIAAPNGHDGIGMALRCAYLPRSRDLPGDIEIMLDRLK